MKSRSTHRLAALALLSALLSAAVSLGARAETIERVVAVVNEDAIFLSELRQKAAPFVARAASAPTQAQRMEAIRMIYTQLLERMIDERLILQAAAEENITVTTTDVNTAISNVRQQSQLDEDEFWDAVRAQGFSESAYRRDVRHQLLRLKVLNERVRSHINITEDDVRRRYDETMHRARRESTFEAEYVRLPLPPEAGAAQIHAATRRAQEIRDGLASADDFAAAISEHGGSRTGRISAHDLAPELGEALASLEVGAISAPVRTPGAIFVLHLLARDVAASEQRPYAEVRMDLYREMLQDAMTRQEELFLEDLRRRALIIRRLEL